MIVLERVLWHAWSAPLYLVKSKPSGITLLTTEDIDEALSLMLICLGERSGDMATLRQRAMKAFH